MMRTRILSAGVLVLAVTASAHASSPGKDGVSHLVCADCHTIEAPTMERPALVACPRAIMLAKRPAQSIPTTLLMKEFADRYGPVQFSHGAHAAMAERGGGCARCHHYDLGRPIQSCRACHSRERFREDVGKPDLLGARHRLCLDCHRSEGQEIVCASCHADRPGKEFDHGRRTGIALDEAHASLDCAVCHGLGFSTAPPSCAECHEDKSFPGDVPGTRTEGAMGRP